MMKKYKVSDNLGDKVTRILHRHLYTFRSEWDENGTEWVYTNCPSDTFHKIVQRAKCELISEEKGIFYITREESKDVFRLQDLLRFYHENSFSIINCDDWPEWLL